MKPNPRCCLVYSICVLLLTSSCRSYVARSLYDNANGALYASTRDADAQPFLKVHTNDGEVYTLAEGWHVDSSRLVVVGAGQHYSKRRKLLADGEHTIPLSDVALYETLESDVEPERGRRGAITTIAALNIALGAFCLTNGKACFGSCPTFYLDTAINMHHAAAEGFSSAIAPSLAYTDVDALWPRVTAADSVRLVLRNEALETHCIAQANLLAIPEEAGTEVLHGADDTFYRSDAGYPLVNARHEGEDVRELLAASDQHEWFSLADSTDLRSKEAIELAFEGVYAGDSLGVVMDFRQTLMTTYFIYSAFDYMGHRYGDILARLGEGGGAIKRLKRGLQHQLGGIEVLTRHGRSEPWRSHGEFYETGPIAINHQVMPVGAATADDSLFVQLRLNRGLWRIDRVALVRLSGQVQPIEVRPHRLEELGRIDSLELARLNDTAEHYLSYPGNYAELHYRLPEPERRYHIFLSSAGYYLEWSRESWLAERDEGKLRRMLMRPRRYLREEAAAYKAYETHMEEDFWNSRIPTNSAYANRP